MSGILDFQQYIGGPDQLQIEQWFPNNTRNLIYNFNQDITGWTFTSDYQTIVVDQLTFSRNTGKPNFSTSSVIGTFSKVNMSALSGGIYVPTVVNATTGLVRVCHPSGMYTGPIVPDARANVPITIVNLTWTDANTPIANVYTHRYALVNCWSPDSTAGDPAQATGYTAVTVG